ncbi:MAG: uroporphyrinogen decarboxylase family protein [Eubacteriaceae bacterium]
MNDVMKKLQEKRERVAKTILREEVDKVPFLLIAGEYQASYVGVDVKDVNTYEQAMEINIKFYEDIQYDVLAYCYIPHNVFTSNFIRILGGGAHVVVDGIKQINPAAVTILQPEEYPELIKDPLNYLLETVYPRRFSTLKIEDPEEKIEKIKEFMGLMSGLNEYSDLYEKNGIPLIMGAISYYNPIDLIMDVLRDFTGVSRDIRRCPELIRDAGLAMVEAYKLMSVMSPPRDYQTVIVPMHLPSFIKPKDFEKIYWPSYKAITEALIEQGHNIMFFFEKNYSHLYDYLQELPQKGVLGVFEEDDIRVVKKKLGNTMAVAGGLSSNLMQYGTKEECINHVKGLIDDLGPGGGYFITNDVPLISPNDARPENLKAVADCINDYGYNK